MQHAHIPTWVRPAALVGGLILSACDRGAARPTESTPPPVASEILIATGDQQVAAVGAPLRAPLVARIVDRGGRGVPGARVAWRVASGAGELSRVPDAKPLADGATATDKNGHAGVLFRPSVTAVSAVTASVAGLAGPGATFSVTATTGVVTIRLFYQLGGCGSSDQTVFVGPERPDEVTLPVGAAAEWLYADRADAWCQARIVSTAVPPGGQPFDSGVLRPGEAFYFVPSVAGTWEYKDAIGRGAGTLTVLPP